MGARCADVGPRGSASFGGAQIGGARALRIVSAILFCIFGPTLAIWLLVVASVQSGGVRVGLVLIASIWLIPVYLLRSLVHAKRLWARRLPSLTIDDRGIADSALNIGTIPWEEIEAVEKYAALRFFGWSLGGGLAVRLRNPKLWKRKLAITDRLMTIFSRGIAMPATSRLYAEDSVDAFLSAVEKFRLGVTSSREA